MSTQKTIEVISSYSKVLTDNQISEILDDLQNKHPTIYRFIYGEPADAINSLNCDMAVLYMELSNDVVWFFLNKFGKLPEIKDHEAWTINKITLLDAELKSLSNEIPMDEKFRNNLQKRFVKRSLKSSIQIQLLQYIENQVGQYASSNQEREKAMQLAINLLFVLVRLFGDLYTLNQSKKA